MHEDYIDSIDFIEKRVTPIVLAGLAIAKVTAAELNCKQASSSCPFVFIESHLEPLTSAIPRHAACGQGLKVWIHRLFFHPGPQDHKTE